MKPILIIENKQTKPLTKNEILLGGVFTEFSRETRNRPYLSDKELFYHIVVFSLTNKYKIFDNLEIEI